jgi:3-vinyl bacteriochlorophyllide hydratase
MYTAEQRAMRQASRWTPVMMVCGLAQLLIIFVSIYLVIRFLNTGQGYTGATITVLVNIVLLWVNTVVGMLWEKEIYNHYFMAREFFWEDFGNLIVLIAQNAYFAVLWLKWSEHDIMVLMLVAYGTYIVNLGQWILKYFINNKKAPNQKA